MKELKEYRVELTKRYSMAAKEFRGACLVVQDEFIPLDKDGWNMHQIAVHVRDVNQLVYGERARRTALEDNPEFQNFDGNVYLSEHYDTKESLGKLLDGFIENVESLAEFLGGLPVEAWSRESRHAMLGRGFTLQTWVERGLAHIEEHLTFVKRGG